MEFNRAVFVGVYPEQIPKHIIELPLTVFMEDLDHEIPEIFLVQVSL